MSKLAIKLVFGFVVLPGSLAATLFHLNKTEFFNIQKVEVLIEKAEPGQENFVDPLRRSLEKDLTKYQGISLWSVRLQEVSRVVAKNEWIENSSIKRSWPSSLTVRIKAHEVKLLYLGKNGKLFPIIKDGSFLEPVDVKQAPDVALVGGDNFTKSELRKKAVAVIEEVPASGAFSKKTISEIRYDQKDGFWMTLIKSGIQVKIGEEQVALKSARVSQVVEYLDSKQFEARVIDANLSKKVLVRLRKDP